MNLRFSNVVPGPAAQHCLGAQGKCRFSDPLNQKWGWTVHWELKSKSHCWRTQDLKLFNFPTNFFRQAQKIFY